MKGNVKIGYDVVCVYANLFVDADAIISFSSHFRRFTKMTLMRKVGVVVCSADRITKTSTSTYVHWYEMKKVMMVSVSAKKIAPIIFSRTKTADMFH